MINETGQEPHRGLSTSSTQEASFDKKLDDAQEPIESRNINPLDEIEILSVPTENDNREIAIRADIGMEAMREKARELRRKLS